MTRYALGLIALGVMAAPQTTATPGQMTQARVWIENRGRNEAVPIDLREANLDAPLRVRVAGPDGADSSTGPMVVRSARIAWEYETVVVTPEQDLVAILNRQGTAGWETTGVTVPTPAGTAMVLKRPR